MTPTRSARWLGTRLSRFEDDDAGDAGEWLELDGQSMAPTLRHGDRLRVHALGGELPTVGDVVVAWRAGRIVAHRLRRIDPPATGTAREGAGHQAVTRGDGCDRDDPPVELSAILGRVVEVRRGGRSFEPPREDDWRLAGARLRAWAGAGTRRLVSSLMRSRSSWGALLLWGALGGGAALAESKPAGAKCDCLDFDPKKIGDIALLDREKQESLEKVEALERTVTDLQERLSRLARQQEAAAAEASSKKSKSDDGDRREPSTDSPPPKAARTTAKKASPPPRPDDDAMVAVSGKRVRVRLSNGLVFTSGGDRITRAGRSALAEVAAVLKKTPSHRIEVNGHTDDTPTGKIWEDNWQLSLERAHRVVSFLIAQGLDPRRFVASGYADTDPVDRGESDESKARNRRVELFIEPTGEKPSEQ